MPAIPNLLERFILVTTNKGPGPVIDLLGAGNLQALSVAIETGILEHLSASGPKPARDVAKALDLDPAVTAAILTLLEPAGYVAAKDGAYRATAMTERWILEGSPTTLGRWLRFWDRLVLPYLGQALPRAVREGPPEDGFYDWLGQAPGRWELAQATFEDLAHVILEQVVEEVPVPDGQARLLDLGGGHGLYTIGLCQAHADLSATLLDLDGPTQVAEANLASEGLTDRVTVQAGDYLTDELGGGYDVVLLFNVLHGHQEPEARRLVERAARALAPGGALVIADQFPGLTIGPATRGMAGLLNLMYLVALGGGTHEAEAVEAWLSNAGLEEIEVKRLARSPGAALITGRSPRPLA